jgi:hypothetical protein
MVSLFKPFDGLGNRGFGTIGFPLGDVGLSHPRDSRLIASLTVFLLKFVGGWDHRTSRPNVAQTAVCEIFAFEREDFDG